MRFALCLMSACLLSALARAQDATPGAQWLSYNNRLDGQRYSPLKEITPENASQLGEVCRVQVDGPTSFHAGFVIVDGVLYTTTGRNTFAIDAATCAVRWKHTYTPDEERAAPSNRGLAVMDGRVFRGTGDAARRVSAKVLPACHWPGRAWCSWGSQAASSVFVVA
jgi:alcohol dehydrogenase (cytochrome c)